MSEPAAISIIYNLNRLGQAGDEVDFSANDDQCAALARLAEISEVRAFAAHIVLRKLSATRFAASYHFQADLVQACVVTLEPLPAHIETSFERELNFTPNLRREAVTGLTLDPDDDDRTEEIDSLHYDLAAPLLEEFILAVEPYPRAPGVEFVPPADGEERPESPFAVLKDLKSGPESAK